MNRESSDNKIKIDEYTQNLVKLAVSISEAAKENQKDYFFGGGLAIDFSLGKISRNHHDIDFHPMLEDASWWKEWFENQGYLVRTPVVEDFPETFKVEDKEENELVDMWPLKLEGGVLTINFNGGYKDAERKWGEVRTVEYQGVEIKIENPERVLEQKLRHAKEGSGLRPEDLHDFAALGKNP